MHAETSGGDIALRGATGPVTAETAGGQIQIGECGATIRAETAGGSIRLQGAKGGVVVETAGGSIDLFRMQSAVRALTSAGRIFAEIDANRATFAASHLETSVGDVQVFFLLICRSTSRRRSKNPSATGLSPTSPSISSEKTKITATAQTRGV